MREFHAGDLIGDYRLEARLGHGGFGTVWRARHVDTGRQAAVKVLPENENLQDSATLRADVELLAASAASSSPHVVQVLAGGTDPVPHVVMEFVNGSSLGEELKNRGKLSQQEVIDIGLGIAEALEALNSAGIVHRDVKPSNVLIDRDGTVKLTDFGIAKIAGYDAVTVTGQLPLSISYAAPEVWEGKAEHRSDLYALGVLLYQCLCGTLPFRGAYAELFYQHRSSQPDLTALPQGTAPSLQDLISLCLRKEPAERPESASTCKALLLRAKEEIARPRAEEPPLVEPEKFGPWVRGDRHEQQPWAWYCTNPETGQTALVEVHFAANAAYGEQLRKAVAENPRLTPLGAEHVLQTNRLILRPGEAWNDPPPGQFQFWVAREEIPLPETPLPVGAAALLGYTESLQALIAEAEDAGLTLHLNSDTVNLLPDGSVHLRRPGLDVIEDANPDQDALDFLKSQPLTRDVRPLVSRASSLEDLRVSLERLQALSAAGMAPPAGRSGKLLAALATAAVAMLAAVAVAGYLALVENGGGQNGDGQGVNPPAATITPQPVAAACLALPMQPPPTIAMAEAACSQGAVLRHDDRCKPGFACNRETVDGVVTVGINDATVALIHDGRLLFARENGQDVEPLSRGSNVTAAAWSPDGKYLAYVTVDSAGGQTNVNEPAVSTQLRIVEPSRPANDGLIVATNNLKEPTLDALERLISSPQWSPDGALVYFLWSLPNAAGGEIFSVQVPRLPSGDVDFSKLPSATLAAETRIDFPMTVYDLSGSDFGVTSGVITAFRVAADGALHVQVCRGTGANRACAIGRWDGSATLLAGPDAGIIYGLPVSSPFDGALHLAAFEAGIWRLVRLEGGTLVTLPINFLEAPASAPPVFSFNRKGDALLMETAPGQLSLVAYGTGTATPWGSGSASYWFVPRLAGAPPLPPPAAIAYATPAATATPSVTPTPQAPLQMTLLLTVRRGANLVSGVRVSAVVNGIECATTITAAGVTTMNFPAFNSPQGCREVGAAIRFYIDGQMLPTPIATYRPQTTQPYDLTVPN